MHLPAVARGLAELAAWALSGIGDGPLEGEEEDGDRGRAHWEAAEAQLGAERLASEALRALAAAASAGRVPEVEEGSLRAAGEAAAATLLSLSASTCSLGCEETLCWPEGSLPRGGRAEVEPPPWAVGLRRLICLALDPSRTPEVRCAGLLSLEEWTLGLSKLTGGAMGVALVGELPPGSTTAGELRLCKVSSLLAAALLDGDGEVALAALPAALRVLQQLWRAEEQVEGGELHGETGQQAEGQGEAEKDSHRGGNGRELKEGEEQTVEGSRGGEAGEAPPHWLRWLEALGAWQWLPEASERLLQLRDGPAPPHQWQPRPWAQQVLEELRLRLAAAPPSRAGRLFSAMSELLHAADQRKVSIAVGLRLPCLSPGCYVPPFDVDPGGERRGTQQGTAGRGGG